MVCRFHLLFQEFLICARPVTQHTFVRQSSSCWTCLGKSLLCGSDTMLELFLASRKKGAHRPVLSLRLREKHYTVLGRVNMTVISTGYFLYPQHAQSVSLVILFAHSMLPETWNLNTLKNEMFMFLCNEWYNFFWNAQEFETCPKRIFCCNRITPLWLAVYFHWEIQNSPDTLQEQFGGVYSFASRTASQSTVLGLLGLSWASRFLQHKLNQ